LALLQTVVGSCMTAGPNVVGCSCQVVGSCMAVVPNVVGSGCQTRPKRLPISIIICFINIIGMKSSMICVMNIIIFTIIKSINIKNIIFCVINIIIVRIINIMNKIITKLEKQILLILKNNHRFDLKGKIKTDYHHHHH
jgi:hypothetical protein